MKKYKTKDSLIRIRPPLLLVFLFLHLSGISLKAQNLDSLYSVWQDDKLSDAKRVNSFKNYIWKGFLFSQPDSAFKLSTQITAFSAERNYVKGQAIGLNMQGISHSIRGNYSEALNYFIQSSHFYEAADDQSGVGQIIGNIGIIYQEQGDLPKALSNYTRSLAIEKEFNNELGISNTLNNIGSIYQQQAEFDLALEYYSESLAIAEKLEDEEAIAGSLENLGNVFFAKKENTKALEYYSKASDLQKKIGNQFGAASALLNIGLVYYREGDFLKALEYQNKSLAINEATDNQLGMIIALENIGNSYIDLKDFANAKKNCQKALDLSEEIDFLLLQKKSCDCLYRAYKENGEDSKALTYIEQLRELEESLNSRKTAKQLQQMEFGKQVLKDSIANAEEKRLIQETHQEEVAKKNKTRNVLATSGLFLLFLVGGLYSRNRFINRSKSILQIEKDRSESLLLNILLEEIAQELKEKGKADARDFDLVSILFTDFKGFTAASAKLSAQDLVSEINVCFEAFDGIIDKYGIEKIKTIGDAYMAAGGLPVPTKDSVKKTVLAALEMQEFISKRKVQNDADHKPAFEMRVGVHTGPVVAGIVGVKKFQYDIWGDTVNTASRMESNGEVDKVNIIQATYELLKLEPEFAFQSRGKIEVKGKGEMEMWFVSVKSEE